MSKLKYSKTFKIKWKRIKYDDIIQIAKLVQNQFKEDDYKDCFDIGFCDGSCIEGSDMDIFSTDQFKRRTSERIAFTYHSKGYENKLEIKLYNSAVSPLDSEVMIKSTNQDWFDSILNQINTIIEEIETQRIKITDSIKYVGLSIISIVEALILNYSLCKIVLNPIPIELSSILTGVFAMFFSLLNVYFLSKIEKAYPKIEFMFGPEHMNTSKKIRRVFGILMPLLIDLIFFALGFIQ